MHTRLQLGDVLLQSLIPHIVDGLAGLLPVLACLPSHVIQLCYFEPPVGLLQLQLQLWLQFVVVAYRQEQVLRYFVVVLKCHLHGLLRVLRALRCLPEQRRFQCEAVRDLELVPANHPSSVQLALVDLEPAVLEREERGHRSEDLGQQPRLRPREKPGVGGLVAPIDEGVHLPVVPVQVTEDLDALGELLVLLLEELL